MSRSPIGPIHSSSEPRVELRPERPHRPAGGGEFRFVVRILAPEVRNPDRERPPLDLAFVVDRSGSMAGGKLELVKRGVEHALRLLDERDSVSLTVYDDKIDVPTPQRRFSHGTHEGVVRRLRHVQARGSTDLCGGWLTGCDQLAPIADGTTHLVSREGRPLCRALLLTDGLANVGITDPSEIAAHAAELHRRGISTTTFGVGDAFDEVLLGQMADAGGGRYHYIAGAADIPTVFAGELGELLAIALRDVSVSLRVPEAWQVSLLNDLPLTRDDGWTTVSLGDLASRDERVLVWEGTLPGAAAGTTESIDARLRWSDPSGGRSIEQIVRLSLEARHDPGEPNAEVLDEIARMYTSRATAEALAFNRAGDYASAREVVRTYVARMPSSAVGQAAAADLLSESPLYSAPMTAADSKMRHALSRRVSRQQKEHTKER